MLVYMPQTFPVELCEKLDAVLAALNGGMPKAAVCRNLGVKRTTLNETLARLAEPHLTGIGLRLNNEMC